MWDFEGGGGGFDKPAVCAGEGGLRGALGDGRRGEGGVDCEEGVGEGLDGGLFHGGDEVGDALEEVVGCVACEEFVLFGGGRGGGGDEDFDRGEAEGDGAGGEIQFCGRGVEEGFGGGAVSVYAVASGLGNG